MSYEEEDTCSRQVPARRNRPLPPLRDATGRCLPCETQQAAASPASTARKGSDSARGLAEGRVTRAAQMYALLLAHCSRAKQPEQLA
jgi:hypothetical protein